jgi:hypothetical protein
MRLSAVTVQAADGKPLRLIVSDSGAAKCRHVAEGRRLSVSSEKATVNIPKAGTLRLEICSGCAARLAGTRVPRLEPAALRTAARARLPVRACLIGPSREIPVARCAMGADRRTPLFEFGKVKWTVPFEDVPYVVGRVATLTGRRGSFSHPPVPSVSIL